VLSCISSLILQLGTVFVGGGEKCASFGMGSIEFVKRYWRWVIDARDS